MDDADHAAVHVLLNALCALLVLDGFAGVVDHSDVDDSPSDRGSNRSCVSVCNESAGYYCCFRRAPFFGGGGMSFGSAGWFPTGIYAEKYTLLRSYFL